MDLVYLCFPNNPPVAVATRRQLAVWVAYARQARALLLFDAAYAEFIREDSLPHSIYEIEGAREVAVDFRSFSKPAGITAAIGLFCGTAERVVGSMDAHQRGQREQEIQFAPE